MYIYSEYAEFLEVNLKKMNMKVDLLFPNPDIPINRVLGTLAQRGTLYVLVVRNENKLYRSVTIDILHGIPEGNVLYSCSIIYFIILCNLKKEVFHGIYIFFSRTQKYAL